MHVLQGGIGRSIYMMCNETSVTLVMELSNSSKEARHAAFIKSLLLL